MKGSDLFSRRRKGVQALAHGHGGGREQRAASCSLVQRRGRRAGSRGPVDDAGDEREKSEPEGGREAAGEGARPAAAGERDRAPCAEEGDGRRRGGGVDSGDGGVREKVTSTVAGLARGLRAGRV